MDGKYNSAIFFSYGGLVVEKLWMLSRGSVYKDMKCVGVVKTRWSGPLVQVCNGMGLTWTQTNKVSYTEMKLFIRFWMYNKILLSLCLFSVCDVDKRWRQEYVLWECVAPEPFRPTLQVRADSFDFGYTWVRSKFCKSK